MIQSIASCYRPPIHMGTVVFVAAAIHMRRLGGFRVGRPRTVILSPRVALCFSRRVGQALCGSQFPLLLAANVPLAFLELPAEVHAQVGLAHLNQQIVLAAVQVVLTLRFTIGREDCGEEVVGFPVQLLDVNFGVTPTDFRCVRARRDARRAVVVVAVVHVG